VVGFKDNHKGLPLHPKYTKGNHISRSHAPAWERILFAPAKRLACEQRRDAGASRLDSHAGAWEPENPMKKSDFWWSYLLLFNIFLSFKEIRFLKKSDFCRK